MTLLDLKRSSDGIPIYGLKNSQEEEIIVYFHHVDGMYSYCTVTDIKGNQLKGVLHLRATTEIEKFKDGYKLAEEKTDGTT